MADQTTNQMITGAILHQLGDNRFLAMTGAKNLLAGDHYLSMKLPGGKLVKITLTAMDDYQVELLDRKGKPLAYREGVYADTLQATFTALTGLETKL